MLLQTGEALLRRKIRNLPTALKPRERRVGDRLWCREAFACRLDGDQLKVRYSADGPQGVPRSIPADEIGPTFHTAIIDQRRRIHAPRPQPLHRRGPRRAGRGCRRSPGGPAAGESCFESEK